MLKFVTMIGSLSPGQTMATCRRNIPQHVARVWPTRCDVLHQFGCCWLKFDKFEPKTSNMAQHITTRWLNARNMLHPTMLRYVVLACCHRLAEALWLQKRWLTLSNKTLNPTHVHHVEHKRPAMTPTITDLHFVFMHSLVYS